MAETVTLVLPLRDIDEVSRWAMQRLRDPHRQSHAGGKLGIAQDGELARRAVQTLGRLLPGVADEALGVTRQEPFASVRSENPIFEPIARRTWGSCAAVWSNWADTLQG